MEKFRTTIFVGTFEVIDGIIAVGDPCYSRNECEHFNAKNGIYNAYVIVTDEEEWGVRVAELIAIHEDIDNGANKLEWETSDISLGVDSGMMGIFDNEYHYDQHYGGLNEKWYDRICEGMDGYDYHIADDSCVISESGFGDGCYDMEVIFDPCNDGTINAVKVIFIDKNNEGSGFLA